MFRKVKFIYNPLAGETRIGDRLDDIIALYQRRGYTIIPYRLDFGGDTSDILEGLDDSFDHILLAGGDGTVNHIVNLLMHNNISVPIAVIPAGTANDFAMMLGTRQGDVVDICRAILNGKSERIDIGKVNGNYFVNVFSCGLFTNISQKTPTILKNTFGKLAYYFSGIGELTRGYRTLDVNIKTDNGNFEGKCLLFLVFNGKTAGTLRLAYLSEVDDGLLDLLIIKSTGPFATIQTALRYFAQIQSGKATSYPAGIEHIRCRHITAVSKTAKTTDIDGQPGPDFPLEITCEINALRVIIPDAGKQKNKN